MSANPNWARWVFASLATYLKQVAEDADIPVLVEGLDRRTTEFMNATDRAEIRITGPFTRHPSKGYYEVSVDTNVLFLSRYEEGKNQYDILKAIGLFHEALDGPIAVYKVGKEAGDDEHAFVGCLEPRRAKGDVVRVLHFGQSDLVDEIKQSLVDARYVMELEVDE
jgi:hypothetical protein